MMDRIFQELYPKMPENCSNPVAILLKRLEYFSSVLIKYFSERHLLIWAIKYINISVQDYEMYQYRSIKYINI